MNYAYRIGYALLNIDHVAENAGIAEQSLSDTEGTKKMKETY
ncbi:hypothetical protein SPRA44_70242 [Serratia proteamaculans]|nr:hypothetical protein SPRA44_70242 [Serratia proteamaculans]